MEKWDRFFSLESVTVNNTIIMYELESENHFHNAYNLSSNDKKNTRYFTSRSSVDNSGAVNNVVFISSDDAIVG